MHGEGHRAKNTQHCKVPLTWKTPTADLKLRDASCLEAGHSATPRPMPLTANESWSTYPVVESWFVE